MFLEIAFQIKSKMSFHMIFIKWHNAIINKYDCKAILGKKLEFKWVKCEWKKSSNDMFLVKNISSLITSENEALFNFQLFFTK